MNKSHVYPKHETNDYDPHADFNQFLQEAKRYIKETNPQASSTCPVEEEAAKRSSRLNREKKKKKLWKKLLLPWWRSSDKKMSSTGMELPAINSQVSNAKRVCVSGPVHSSSGNANDGRHSRRPTSGPLTTLFNPTRKADNEIPYMCLNQLPSPRGGHSYGPVYMVT
ncbi:hypothetical protein FNV43_RR08042 [Rhamnella rubrinervis]|uniref:Uncharacterized protein n=1 Tax=Rhamnella rubrinervis TaxID=2594499 RepID=A0A8K0HGD8_9ROSA|nr:hypothetical protein FNV43_RR08042 [Rhamnella rubrinervis]